MVRNHGSWSAPHGSNELSVCFWAGARSLQDRWSELCPVLHGIENAAIKDSRLPDSGRRAQPAPLNNLPHHARNGP
jgi:hypothetical protein